jgi:hypothetical protein
VAEDDVAPDNDRESLHLGWTATLIRILALWVFASTAVVFATIVANLGTVANMPGGTSPTRFLYPQAIGFITRLAVALVLWSTAGRLASAIWRDRAVAVDLPEPPIDADMLQRVFCAGIGLYVVAQAADNLPGAIAEYLQRRATLRPEFAPFAWARLAGVALELAVGVAMFVGRAGLARFVRRMREAR